MHQIKNTVVHGAFYLVREKGLEPSRPKALAPKASVSTNSTTRAYGWYRLNIAGMAWFAKRMVG